MKFLPKRKIGINNRKEKSTIGSMIKKLPGDLLKKKIILRQRHINSLIDELKIFDQIEVMVMEGYLSCVGTYSKSPIMLTFNQKLLIVNNEIHPPKVFFKMKNNTHHNYIKINLDEISGFKKYLSFQHNISILNELTLDTIEINNGYITLSSIEKVDITIKEGFINKMIQEELIGKYGIKRMHIILKNGYLIVNGKFIVSDQEIEINKSIKLINIDLYKNKYIEIELDAQDDAQDDALDDKISATIRIDKINKINKFMTNKVFKFLIDKWVLNKNIKIEFDKEKERIVLSYKGSN